MFSLKTKTNSRWFSFTKIGSIGQFGIRPQVRKNAGSVLPRASPRILSNSRNSEKFGQLRFGSCHTGGKHTNPPAWRPPVNFYKPPGGSSYIFFLLGPHWNFRARDNWFQKWKFSDFFLFLQRWLGSQGRLGAIRICTTECVRGADIKVSDLIRSWASAKLPNAFY